MNTLRNTHIQRLFLSIIVVISIAFTAFSLSSTVGAQDIQRHLECGANLQFTVPPEGCATDDAGVTAAERVDQIVTQIINILSLIVGVVAVIMIIIGGLRYVTSGGDSGSVGNAKNTILYAIVGLVVVALSQVIVRFVIDRATITVE